MRLFEFSANRNLSFSEYANQVSYNFEYTVHQKAFCTFFTKCFKMSVRTPIRQGYFECPPIKPVLLVIEDVYFLMFSVKLCHQKEDLGSQCGHTGGLAQRAGHRWASTHTKPRLQVLPEAILGIFSVKYLLWVGP